MTCNLRPMCQSAAKPFRWDSQRGLWDSGLDGRWPKALLSLQRIRPIQTLIQSSDPVSPYIIQYLTDWLNYTVRHYPKMAFIILTNGSRPKAYGQHVWMFWNEVTALLSSDEKGPFVMTAVLAFISGWLFLGRFMTQAVSRWHCGLSDRCAVITGMRANAITPAEGNN